MRAGKSEDGGEGKAKLKIGIKLSVSRMLGFLGLEGLCIVSVIRSVTEF